MRFFYRLLSSIFQRLFIFLMIFFLAQLNRELLVRSLVVHTVGPFKIEKTLYIDESFSREENLIIIQAANQWNMRTQGVALITVHINTTASEYITLKDPKAISITKMNSWEPFIQEVEDEMGKLLGLYTKRFVNPIIVIVPNRIGDDLEFRATTMHEIGHALGMDHNPRKWTLMYPSEDYGAYSITNEDIKQFCLIYFCDPEKLSH